MGGIKIFIPDMRGQWDSGSFVEIWWLCATNTPQEGTPEPSKAKKLTMGGIKDNNSYICKGMVYRELCGNTVALCYEDPRKELQSLPKQK